MSIATAKPLQMNQKAVLIPAAQCGERGRRGWAAALMGAHHYQCRSLDSSLARWHPRPPGAAGQMGGVT